MVDKPSSRTTLQWFLRKDSIAQCFIRDVHQAPAASCQDSNFFWYLGTVPFRAVRFVGIVTGVRVYERRSLYFVDDGTATIQCIYSHPVTKPCSAIGNLKRPGDFVAPSVEPLCEVGTTVRIVGRVESWRDTRQINIEELAPCCSGEEMKHWIATASLHKTYYCKPFVIPPLAPPTPVKLATTPTKDSVNTSAPLSKSLSISAGVLRSTDDLLRLRHPSRLRSKELTKNVFKIYMKNYMDIVSHNSFRPYPYHKHPSSRSSQIKGFKLSYLRQVPELYSLSKRVATSDPTSSNLSTRLTAKKLFIWAIRELIKEGTVVLHDGNGPVWETLDHRISVWRVSKGDDSKTSKSSIMKNSTNISRYSQEVVELSDPPPREESYIPLIPEVLCPFTVNVLKELSKSHSQRAQSDGRKGNNAPAGISVREVRHQLNQDMRWEYIGDYIIIDTLYLLERMEVVESVNGERWKLRQ